MATRSEAYAVKSLNKSSGRKRFTFKSFAQRVAEVDINVYRSLDPLKSEPSEGSSFFRDCLVEWRELNTAEDFISFYEEVFPLVQTLPQIILQKELILSKILARLQMKSRLSLEPILSLVAALSRDLVDDFLPFLPRIVDSLVFLLKSGAEREPEIMEQIFTSWSCIMMYMQKYLTKDLVHLLKVTLKLRFYPKDYVQEFVAESVSFIFRNASLTQLIKGIRKVLKEVAVKPSPPRKFGISELLRFTMRGSATRLHSRATVVLRLLLDKSSFDIGAQVGDGSDCILEVLTLALSRLNEELDPKELNLMWDCLLVEVSDAVVSDCPTQISPLLSLLISASQNRLLEKLSDYQPVLQLARSLVVKFITPRSEEDMNHPTEVIDKVLKLLLCILDGLHSVNDMQAISDVSLDWAPIFSLHNSSLISFLEDLLFKDVSVLLVFKIHIIRALDDLLQVSEEAVMNLLLILLDKLQISTSGFLEGTPRETFSRVRCYICDVFDSWIQTIKSETHGNLLSLEVYENRLAILWAAVKCYPYVVDGQENLSLLVDLLNALDGLLMIESEYSKNSWQGLIGALLKSQMQIILGRGTGMDESEIGKFLGFAEKYHSSSQILSAVADFLDSVSGLMTEEQVTCKTYHLELQERKSFDALETFSGNLCHSDQLLRLSSLRILRHYGSLNVLASCEQPDENKVETGDSGTGLTAEQGGNVLEVLLLIESTPLSIDTSRRVNLLLSRLQMSVSAGRIAKRYVPALLYGVIGIFHKRFSYIWNPAMECLSASISHHFGSIWDRFIQYLGSCQSMLLLSHGQSCRVGEESHNRAVDLVGRFNAFVAPFSDSTPCATVFLLLTRSLQKVSSLVESRTRQIVPLFLKFLGYDMDNLTSVEVYNLQKCKGKEWKEALKEWLNLFRLMRNPKSFFLSQFLKEVFLYRLLDDNDAEQQTRVLDCLLNWKDEFLVPYGTHLRNLIISKNLREELTTWSLSRESNLIDGQHRRHFVPIVIRILVPKVRKLKTLSARKHSSVHHRRAILGFLAQLEIDELSLLFELLIFPLQTAAEGANANGKWIRTSQPSMKDEFGSLSILKLFTMDGMKHISWKKLYSFLHVIIEILEVFDEWHISPFLDLLLGSVVRVLESCTKSLDCLKSNESSHDPSYDSSKVEHGGETNTKIMTSTSMKQFRELRSLSLKIISSALQKYESYDFGYDFWECFFIAVKPLIIGFKQEGASSEKPNSLFSCFLAMSRSLKFAPLLSREKNLVPDIFSILTVPTASNAVVSAVLNLVENLLTLDSEVGDEDSPVKKMLLSHLDVLLFSLHNLFTRDRARQRMLVHYRGDKGLALFKLLSKYVKEPSAATKFIEILLPLLEKRSQDSDLCVNILQIIRNVVPFVGSEISEKVISSLSPLLTFVGREIRLSICDVLNSLAQSDSSVLIVAKMLSELNASSSTDIDGLDYDTITGAYEKINSDFFYNLKKGHALIFLSHSIYDLSSEEMILRQSAYGMLLSFVDFCCEILTIKGKSDRGCWSEACVQQVLSKFLLKHMGNAMYKETTIQKGWIDLLREMVLKIPMVANLESYRLLYSQDPEQDFFSNIVHLQKHRRARALSKFIHVFSSYSMSEVITNKVFVPLFFNTLLDLHQGKGENIRSACLEALGLVSGCMSWKQYRALLMRCFREMNIKRDKQKVLLRLICSILDHFHFSSTELSPKAIGSTESNQTSESCGGISAELVDIQAFLHGTLLSRIQGLLSSSSDNLNVNVCLVALKLLKLLPREMMDSRLPTIIHRICSFLKNRLESVRDEARAAMAACLKELGLEYLQVMVHAMKSILKKGYELHVLGFSVHFLLTKFLVTPSSGKLDYCLDDLLSVMENDIFGDVSEQKDVEKIASKMKETRKQKSYDTLKLIAQSITFQTHALKLLSPVTVHLQKQLTPKVKLKLESMLNHIAMGIECNPSVNKTDLFIFVYRLIKEGIGDENFEHRSAFSSKTEKQDGDDLRGQKSNPDRLIHIDPRYSHLVTAFGLRLLQNYMKLHLRKKDEDLLSLLDPFVSLLCDCLDSKCENIVSAAVRCLSPLIGIPLASLESQANKIKNSLLVIAQGSGSAGSPLMESCLRLLMLLLRSTKITLSADQLHMLIQFPLFIDIERNPSFVALSLLKAIVNRKLVVAEVYDVVKRVAELMVTSQVESVRKKCSQILLQFLREYHLSEKRKQEHLDFLLANLRYEHSSGREAVLEMLHAIIMKFPPRVIDEQSQTLFVHLVVCLSNDSDRKVRSMAGAVIKLLIGCVTSLDSSKSLDSILEYSLSWYLGEQKHLWSAAAQVLGLLVEVMKKGFQECNTQVLPVIQRILQSSVSAVSNSQDDTSDGEAVPLWKEAYYSLVLVEKLLLQFDGLYFDKDLEEMWESICDLLLHPHLWLRNITNRLIGLYLTHVTEASTDTSFMMRPGRLFLLAASHCCQLRANPNDDTACTFITQNLVFSIYHLHSFLCQRGCLDFPKFWVSLDISEQQLFHRAFQVLDPKKGRSLVAYLTSGLHDQQYEQNTEAQQHFLVSYLLKKMGKLSFQVEAIQMKIIFNCFRLLSQKFLRQRDNLVTVLEDNNPGYAYQMLLPLYRVCEGYAGQVISDDMKQSAQEVCDSIRDDMGMQNFVQVYSKIRQDLKLKRDKRKQQQKRLAVVNPMRNAKRKLRTAEKKSANKRRKIMTLKMGKWMR